MQVEVVYATPALQKIVVVRVGDGATIADALAAAQSIPGFPALNIPQLRVGIYGKLAEPGTPVQDGDRVEIYRPLLVEPMQARRRRAAKKKAVGNTER